MTNSKHLGVRNAILTLFTTSMASANPKAGRAWSMADQDDKLIKVYLDTSDIERAELNGQPDDWKTRIRVELHARGTSTAPAEDIADDMLSQAYALVMADPSLGGRCIDCHAIGMAWGTDEAETSIAVAQVVFVAQHRTAANSITA